MLKIICPMPTPGAVRRGSVHTERPNGPPAHRRLADLGASVSPTEARGCPEA
jgi:hypothetical protein